MTEEQYYTAPPQEVFDEIKREAIKIWKTYDNISGYVDDKLSRIQDIENVQDNAWYIVAMFDGSNKSKLINSVSDTTADMIRDAMSEDSTERDSFIKQLLGL